MGKKLKTKSETLQRVVQVHHLSCWKGVQQEQELLLQELMRIWTWKMSLTFMNIPESTSFLSRAWRLHRKFLKDKDMFYKVIEKKRKTFPRPVEIKVDMYRYWFNGKRYGEAELNSKQKSTKIMTHEHLKLQSVISLSPPLLSIKFKYSFFCLFSLVCQR